MSLVVALLHSEFGCCTVSLVVVLLHSEFGCCLVAECNCHGKAAACVYNATVDALGLSLNMEGKYEGGGVCLNCQVILSFS